MAEGDSVGQPQSTIPYTDIITTLLCEDHEKVLFTYGFEEWRTFLQDHTSPLTEKHEQIIFDNYTMITNRLDVNDVIDSLIEDRIVSDRQRETIFGKPTKEEKNRELLSIILGRPENGFYALCKALFKDHTLCSAGNKMAQKCEFLMLWPQRCF